MKGKPSRGLHGASKTTNARWLQEKDELAQMRAKDIALILENERLRKVQAEGRRKRALWVDPK